MFNTNHNLRKNLHGTLEGIAFSPDKNSAILLYGQGFCMYIDLMLDIPLTPKLISAASVNPNSILNKYKKVSAEKRIKTNNDNSNFTIINKYRSLVHVGFVKNKQLVHHLHIIKHYSYFSRFPLSDVFLQSDICSRKIGTLTSR